MTTMILVSTLFAMLSIGVWRRQRVRIQRRKRARHRDYFIEPDLDTVLRRLEQDDGRSG